MFEEEQGSQCFQRAVSKREVVEDEVEEVAR